SLYLRTNIYFFNATFELFHSENNQKFYFNLKAKNGQVIVSSQVYADKSGAINGIESVKTNCGDDAKFERKTASNGNCQFNRKSGNATGIGCSQMCASAS